MMDIRPTGTPGGGSTTLLGQRKYPGHGPGTPPAVPCRSRSRRAGFPESRSAITVAMLLVGAIGLLTLNGCGRETSPKTAGERLDNAIEKTQDKLGEARQSAEDAAKATGTAITDTAITGAVKTQLAADDDLKMLDISVETRSGRTVLQGKVPNEAARERATRIAAAVTGVSSVDNQLEVRP